MVAIDVFFHVRVAGSMILADQGYDTDEILVFIENKDAQYTISPCLSSQTLIFYRYPPCSILSLRVRKGWGCF